MRLWHELLIPKLPRQQLLGQHRECCALRGHGWNKKHATVNYVFQHSPYKLYQYHMKVINEMK
ncbi:pyrimidine dimer DNA glycosylase/endonuclease V, partial [Salmonella enterica]|uniref:pyrimidine dimer DNA glycosylase/endonuclease V n=1 Tax=Salmonella enterica TaxID=28901 RepID=UPI003CEAD696